MYVCRYVYAMGSLVDIDGPCHSTRQTKKRKITLHALGVEETVTVRYT